MTELHDAWKLRDNTFVCNFSVPSSNIFLVRLCCDNRNIAYAVSKSESLFFNSDFRMIHNFYIKKHFKTLRDNLGVTGSKFRYEIDGK